MTNDKRDIVQVLEKELTLLQNGWYDRWAEASWRAPLVFEDSPTCPNFRDPLPAHPCSHCALMQFVPAPHLEDSVPCRHIPLNAAGETLETLYRTGTIEERKVVLGKWLVDTIKGLKEKRAHFRPDGQHAGPEFSDRAVT